MNWREAELDKLGVIVRCNLYAGATDVLVENPDHVFVAISGLPAEKTLPGTDLVANSWDLLSGDVQAEQDVLVCDHTGAGCAVIGKGPPRDTGSHRRSLRHRNRVYGSDFHKQLAAQGVTTLAYLKLSAVPKKDNRLVATLTHKLPRQTQEVIVEQVVLETGTVPLGRGILFDLREGAANKGISDVGAMTSWSPQLKMPSQGYTLHQLGAPVTSRSIHAALLEAYRLAVHI